MAITINDIYVTFDLWGFDDKPFICLIQKERWPNGIICPFCNCQRIYETKRGYACAGCSKKFSITVGTIFENTKLPFCTIFSTILEYLLNSNVSSIYIANELAMTQPTAWKLLKKIKPYCNNGVFIIVELHKEKHPVKYLKAV
jgi:hypothetical protein